jgi:hypothetical protein
MNRAIEGRRFGIRELREGPPHWAIAAVKACVVGMLLLPATTLLWLVATSVWPAETSAVAPIAFALTGVVAVSLFACVTYLTGAYPPVPPAKRS